MKLPAVNETGSSRTMSTYESSARARNFRVMSMAGLVRPFSERPPTFDLFEAFLLTSCLTLYAEVSES